MGAAVLALFAFTAASRASVVVNDLTDTVKGNANDTGNTDKAQVFTTEVSGVIDNITLMLNVNNAAGEGKTLNVYIDTVSGGAPVKGQQGILIGSVTTESKTFGVEQVPVNLSDNYSLTAGQSYAIVVNLSSGGTYSSGADYNVGWEYAPSGASSTGNGTFGNAYNGSASTSWAWANQTGQQRMMELDVVPEVPMTGMVMGFGALAIAAGDTLRRKLCGTKSV